MKVPNAATPAKTIQNEARRDNYGAAAVVYLLALMKLNIPQK